VFLFKITSHHFVTTKPNN